MVSSKFSLAHETTASDAAAPSVIPIYEKPITNYTDFVSILLAAVTVLLALVGIWLAVLAFFTLKGIKESASATAEQVAKDRLQGIDQRIKDQINEVLFREGLPNPSLDTPDGDQSQNHNH